MAKHLVIVESPTKARTMKRYLGADFVIDASMGHVRDLPVSKISVDIKKDFTPTYEISKGKNKVIAKLKKRASEADIVYLAPDPDREGEAIAWHLKEALNLPNDKVQRITFDEFTKSAIADAFKHPGDLRMDLVNAQQARRILDRIVGYKISPLLWKRIQPGLSAGRVQSVAVRIIVDRERRIRAFEAKPQSEKEYWTIKAIFSRKDRMEDTFEATLKLDDKKELKTSQEARALLDEVSLPEYRVAHIDQKDQSVAAAPPFSTATLLAAASSELRFSTKRTMIIAQQLYEGIEVGARGAAGLITYMRTDSFNLSKQALSAAREFIAETFGDEYLPSKPKVYRAGKGAQEAHEAVRPTDVTLTPEKAELHLTSEQFRLYDLIWRRFVACQMPPARYKNTVVEIPAADRIFQARGKELLFDGYTRALGYNEKDQILPPLEVGSDLHRHDVTPEQHFEQPPPRYTEATLIGELKKQGIGRPSTYSPIISTIQTRKYVVLGKEDTQKKKKKNRRTFYPTSLGEVVTDHLVKHFPNILNLKFTSQMEENLDEIAEAKRDWITVLKDFYGPFAKALKDASSYTEESEYTCPECGKPLVYKFSRAQRFLGCSGYPKCKFSAPVDSEGKMTEREQPKLTEHACPTCGEKMILREGRYGEFFACSGYPDCKTTMNVGKNGKPVHRKKDEVTDLKCPKCDSPMVKKVGKRGPFLACSAYPKCKTTMNLDEDGKPTPKKINGETTDEKCPKCGSPMVRKAGKRGPFFACSAYPKCKTAMSIGEDGKPVERGKARKTTGKKTAGKKTATRNTTRKKTAPDAIGTSKPPPEPTDYDCPECGKKLVIRKGRYGQFFGCSGYPKCKTTLKVDQDGKPVEK